MRTEMTIHHVINYKSHRKGLINDSFLQWNIKKFHEVRKSAHVVTYLTCYSYPANTYPVFYPRVYGKKHSQYPKF